MHTLLREPSQLKVQLSQLLSKKQNMCHAKTLKINANCRNHDVAIVRSSINALLLVTRHVGLTKNWFECPRACYLDPNS